MNMWEVLGIKPTSDVSEIRKAYAARLRIHHPEDDPEGYQRLREAYDRAVKLAKQSGVRVLFSPTADDSANDIEASSEEENIREIFLSNPEGNFSDTPALEVLNNEFMSKVEDLYRDFFLRIQTEKWVELLNCDVMWNIDNKEQLSIRMLEFLSNHRYLPKNVWKLLDMSFHISSRDKYAYPKYKEIIAFAIKQLIRKRALGFDHFRKDAAIDFEKFLSLRESAFQAFSNNDTLSALSDIEEAKLIYPDDPDLICLEGRRYLLANDKDKALPYFERALSINGRHTESLLKRADILFGKGQFSSAAKDYRAVLDLEPDNHEVLLSYAACCLDSGDLRTARMAYKRVLETNPKDTDLKAKLSHVNQLLLKKLKSDIRDTQGNMDLKKQYRGLKKEEAVQSNWQRKMFLLKAGQISLVISGVLIVIVVVVSMIKQYMDQFDSISYTEQIQQELLNQTVSQDKDENQVNQSEYGLLDDENPVDLDNQSDYSLLTSGTHVYGNVSDITMLALKSIVSSDSSGGAVTKFRTLFKGEASAVDNDDDWVYVGKVGDKELIIVSPPIYFTDSTNQGTINFDNSPIVKINGAESISFTGTIKNIINDDMINSVESLLAKGKAPEDAVKNLVTDKYIVIGTDYLY